MGDNRTHYSYFIDFMSNIIVFTFSLVTVVIFAVMFIVRHSLGQEHSFPLCNSAHTTEIDVMETRICPRAQNKQPIWPRHILTSQTWLPLTLIKEQFRIEGADMAYTKHTFYIRKAELWQ